MSTAEGHVGISHEVTPLKNGRSLLRVRCSGVYALGSAGASQAKEIYDRSASLAKHSKCRAVLLDFQELEYRWGDDMWWPLQLPGHPLLKDEAIDLAVLLGKKNRKALISLIEDDGGCEPWQSIGFVFETAEEAVHYLESK